MAVVADAEVEVARAVAAVAAVVTVAGAFTVGVCCLAFSAVVGGVAIVAGNLCLL